MLPETAAVNGVCLMRGVLTTAFTAAAAAAIGCTELLLLPAELL
jgi:hypothetical protein